jgi:SAM-dependent MidA family methyltransferase
MLPDISKFTSRDDIASLIKLGGIGVELGVAEGIFSEKILRKSQLSHLYSIDMYAGDRGHNEAQYIQAQELLDPYKERSSLIRKTFDDALIMFNNEYFDFIYIDGYAHTGQEEGATIHNWYPKLKKGGIISGDDYSEKWPKVIEQVDRFIALNNLKLHVIKDWNGHHSWFTVKP